MRTNRKWLARVAAFLTLALTSSTGCQTWYGGLTLPSGRYLDGHFPQFFAPDPAFPLPRELASMEAPAGAPGGPALAPGPVPAAPGAPLPGAGNPGAAIPAP
jgi:hypothetical protein